MTFFSRVLLRATVFWRQIWLELDSSRIFVRDRQIFTISFFRGVLTRRINYLLIRSAIFLRDFRNVIIRGVNPRVTMMTYDVATSSIIRMYNAMTKDCFQGRPRLIRHFFFMYGSVGAFNVDRIVRIRIRSNNNRRLNDRRALIRHFLIRCLFGRTIKGSLTNLMVLNVRFRCFKFNDPVLISLEKRFRRITCSVNT